MLTILLPSFLDTHSMSISFLGCKTLCIIINFIVLWSICLSSSHVKFRNGPNILQGLLPRCLFLWWDFCCWAWLTEVFSFDWSILWLFFFHFCLFDYVCFQYSLVLIIFLFSNCFNSFSIWQFYSFRYLSFSLFIMSMAHVYMPNSIPIHWLNILIVCISL